mmetsp:Transcript_60320/g.108625  ORF Transcript_60320/g.108625 Transcript_60320/m.108625 type:complete len:283 (+) Transcript_60320:826-1674(+)
MRLLSGTVSGLKSQEEAEPSRVPLSGRWLPCLHRTGQTLAAAAALGLRPLESASYRLWSLPKLAPKPSDSGPPRLLSRCRRTLAQSWIQYQMFCASPGPRCGRCCSTQQPLPPGLVASQAGASGVVADTSTLTPGSSNLPPPCCEASHASHAAISSTPPSSASAWTRGRGGSRSNCLPCGIRRARSSRRHRACSCPDGPRCQHLQQDRPSAAKHNLRTRLLHPDPPACEQCHLVRWREFRIFCPWSRHPSSWPPSLGKSLLHHSWPRSCRCPEQDSAWWRCC